MLIRSCFSCKFHEVKQEKQEKISRCIKENCYAQYSKCVTTKALKKFLEQESSASYRPFSAIDHVYSWE